MIMGVCKMKLSKRQLSILADKLSDMIYKHELKPVDSDFAGNVEFEDMLCLAMDIDDITANNLYQDICNDIDSTMGLPILSNIIAKHTNNLIKKPIA